MNFQIMRHAGGRDFIPAIDERTNKPLIYNDAKKGAIIAAELTKAKGIKFQLRPLAEMVDWHERERNRFKNGAYKPVLWVDETWWKEIDGHFAHISVKDPTRIAFTPDAIKGKADRQTAMLPGKYLKQFFGNVLDAEQIRDYAMQHNNEFEQNEIKWAKTAEEIEHVYKVGPDGSCFKGTNKANLYATEDFAVAYLQDEDGRITARAVCAVNRKVYPYAYGDRDRLHDLLRKAGYKLSTNGTDYNGLRLLKKWHWDGFYTDWYPNRSIKPDPNNPEFLIVKA
jgi:hypothetical protein